MNYVTLAQAKTHLRVDTNVEDDDINTKIMMASSSIKAYLKDASPYEPLRDTEDTPTLDSSGDPEYALDNDSNRFIRYEVQAATLIMVQWLYDRDPSVPMTAGYLPDPVVSLLFPLRDPALA